MKTRKCDRCGRFLKGEKEYRFEDKCGYPTFRGLFCRFVCENLTALDRCKNENEKSDYLSTLSYNELDILYNDTRLKEENKNIVLKKYIHALLYKNGY